MSQLAKFTKMAKSKSSDELRFAINDIKGCWEANSDWREPDNSYGEKLWAEYDAYVVELHNRTKGK